MSEPGQDNAIKVPEKIGNQELFHAGDPGDAQFPGEASGIQRKSGRVPVLLIVVALAMAAFGAFVYVTQGKPGILKMSAESDDLGAGISQASGLRGHLVVRWQGKTQYMLKIEPLDPRDAQGFAAVTSNPSRPISINLRLLDSGGFALCGKTIALPYDSGRGNHAAAPKPGGSDTFRNIQGTTAAVEALWAEGELPCSADQYKHFDYWDMSTNFPTLAEQDQLLGRKPAETMRDAEVARSQDARSGDAHENHDNAEPTQRSRASRTGAKRRVVKKQPPAYLVQGDDRATEFDATRGVLVVGVRTRFSIDRKSDEAMVASWAEEDSLIHFTCDSRANCSLRRAGTQAIVPARMNE